MIPEGRARVENEVIDASFLVQAGVQGIPALLGETMWGDPTKSVLIGSDNDYVKFFGGNLENSDFPMQVRRMLRRGAPVRVARVKPAEGTLTFQAEVESVVEGALAIYEGFDPADLSTVTTSAVILDGEDEIVHTLNLTNLTNSILDEEAYAESFTVNTVEFTFLATPTSTTTFTYTITSDIETALGNDLVFVLALDTSEQVINTPQIQEGITPSEATITYDFFSFGAMNGADRLPTLSVLEASSGDITKVDLKVSIAGFPSLDVTVPDINRGMTAGDIVRFNSLSFHVKIAEDGFSGDYLYGSDYELAVVTNSVLEDGHYGDPLVTNDYIGSAIDQTGIYVFDNDSDFIRIAVPMVADPLLDAELVQYAITRGDCRAWLRTPMGTDGRTAIDYRKGQGAYSHTPIDTWRASMIYGDINITVPSFDNPSVNIDKDIHALTEVLASASLKDKNTFNWFATAGSERGKIPNNNGVAYNLGTPARALEFDMVDKAGINAVIKDADFGTVYWGNGTLQRDATLLSFENIAELMIYLSRVINPIAKSKLFNPNDPETWINIYRRVDAIMIFVKDNRGVYDYEYQGDQFVTDVTKVLVNTTANIDAGQYIFHLFVKPIGAMKYVGIKSIVTNSGASFELL